MSETVTLEVTQDDIDKGMRWEVHMCPFALAGKRLFGTPRVTVNCAWMIVHPDVYAGSEHWELPMGAGQDIRYFDKTGQMQPGTYILTRAWKIS